MLTKTTPLLLTFNEEQNVGRAIAELSWARQVIVIDSGSKDATQSIARSFSNVKLIVNAFRDHAEQWNFGLEQVESEWVLTLDADYMIGAEFAAELSSLEPTTEWGYRANFKYAVDGKVLRGSLYPPRTVLFRPRGALHFQDGHTQRLRESGPVKTLRSRIIHDDRKPMRRWIDNQVRYAQLEARTILRSEGKPLRNLLRRSLVVTPLAMPIYLLVARGLVLDGKAGFRYALERSMAECLISISLLRHSTYSESEPQLQNSDSGK